PPAASTVHTHFLCTIGGGVFYFSLSTSGEVVDLSHVNAGLKWVSSAGNDYGAALNIQQFNDERIYVSVEARIPGIPGHHRIRFVLNKRPLAVETNYYRKKTPQELSKCSRDIICELEEAVVTSSSGTCENRQLN